MNLTEQLIRRGDHRSVYALEADIRAWVKNWNEDSIPFVWTKTAQDILESLGRLIKSNWRRRTLGKCCTFAITLRPNRFHMSPSW